MRFVIVLRSAHGFTMKFATYADDHAQAILKCQTYCTMMGWALRPGTLARTIVDDRPPDDLIEFAAVDRGFVY